MMNCELIFFNSSGTKFKNAVKQLISIQPTSMIYTNSDEVRQILSNLGKEVLNINEEISKYGQTGKEIYEYAKEIRERYRQIFDEFTFNGIKAFVGFEYTLYRQLFYLSRFAKVLEKKENILIILDGYFPVYHGIIKLAKEIGYDTKSKLGYLTQDKLEYELPEDTKKFVNYQNEFSFLRAKNFIKRRFEDERPFKKINILSSFALGIISLGLRQLRIKYFRLNKDQTKRILNNIDKKILHRPEEYHSECVLFITTTRLDLFLRPWLPVLKKLKEKRIPYQIFTSDLTTGILLSNEGIPFVNLFEEVNLLSEEIRISNIGKKIHEKILQNIEKTYHRISDLESMAYRSYAVTMICEHVIKKMRSLKSIIAASDGEMLENLAIESARKIKIPSFTLAQGTYEPDPIFSEWAHSDYILIYGEFHLNSLHKIGYSKDRLLITGDPKYDYFNKLDKTQARNILEKDFGISQKKQLVVVGMSSWKDNDEEWISNLIRFCNTNDLEIVIKVHPRYKSISKDISEEKIKKIKTNCKNNKFIITYDMKLEELLPACDLFITEYSTIGFEAILLDKPVVTVNFQKVSFEGQNKYHEDGAAVFVGDDYSKLEETIYAILKKGEYNNKLSEGRKRFIQLHNYYNDGKAAERIFTKLMGS